MATTEMQGTKPPQAIILAAGRSMRGAEPSAVANVDGDSRVLDWLLDAFSELGQHEVCVVTGYQGDIVAERYPGTRVLFNREWDTTGPVRSLALAFTDPNRETWACYADIVFRPSAVRALRDAPGDVVLAVDSHWQGRYGGRRRSDLERAEKVVLAGSVVEAIGSGVGTDGAHAEFAGVMKCTPRGAAAVAEVLRSGAVGDSASLPDLLGEVRRRQVSMTVVDLEGDWAELDAPQDLARFVLGTKAESLVRLSRMNHGGTIGPLVWFTRGDWFRAEHDLLARVLNEIPGQSLIVRSSSRDEDGWLESGAGRYTSMPRVARTPAAIRQAVITVLASYRGDDADEQVLVQEMLDQVVLSGVVMTRTPSIGAPYYVLNFDDHADRTDGVTSGRASRTFIVHRGGAPGDALPPRLQQVLRVVQNLEMLVAHDSLDVEFAVTPDDQVHILQVRPIAIARVTPVDDASVGGAVQAAERFLAACGPARPALAGRSTRYSVMSDWNPAEIVGTKPRRLAISLYRYLITDDVWARQRAEYGYRDVRPCPLLVEFAGHPYVDVRASCSSFIPSVVSDDLAERLVDGYLGRLAAHPHLHDKIEFDIVFSCLTADFDAQAAARLLPAGLTPAEVAVLREALRDITQAAVDRTAADVSGLGAVDAGIAATCRQPCAPLDKAFYLLEDARRSATLLFAHLARSAFVATSLLRSMAALAVVPVDELNRFLESIETVMGRLLADGARVSRGERSWQSLVDTYGHLRPGTYDITSLCYRQAPEQYLRPLVEEAQFACPRPTAAWSPSTRKAIEKTLSDLGLDPDVDRLTEFARAAIAGREEAKFIFTKALSAALESLAEYGASLRLSRVDVAHVGISDLLLCRDVIGDPRGFLLARAREGRRLHETTQAMCLPGQLAAPADVRCFELAPAEPNFVTQRVVEGEVAVHGLSPARDVRGRMVLVESADPGCDWLLTRGIAGLITMYGGANSHIAVRAAELGLPAAIGVGELRYAELERAKVVRLDCAARLLTVVRHH